MSSEKQASIGRTECFDKAKDYGFIVGSQPNDLTTHHSHIQMSGLRQFTEGEAVENDAEFLMNGIPATGLYNHKAYHSQVSDWHASGRIHHQNSDTIESLLQSLYPSKYKLLFLGLEPVTLMQVLDIIAERCKGLGTSPVIVALMQQYSSTIRSKILSAGADWVIELNDDYAVVNARIDAVLRRCRLNDGDGVLDFYPYRLNRRSLEIRYADHSKVISDLDFRLLEYLFVHNDETHSREKLLKMVWNQVSPESNRRVDTKVSQLRKNLDLDGSFGWKICADRKARGYRLCQLSGFY